MKYLILFFLSFPLLCFGQNPQLEINRQVWEPFTKAYQTNDAELFNSIHSDNIVRVTSRAIQEGDAYKQSMYDFLNGMKKNGQKMSIDFRFEQRIHSENIAYEVGYYRLTIGDSKASKDYYGCFHVVLKKENDVWKIVQDYDTPKVLDLEVNQDVFQLGKQMSEVFK